MLCFSLLPTSSINSHAIATHFTAQIQQQILTGGHWNNLWLWEYQEIWVGGSGSAFSRNRIGSEMVVTKKDISIGTLGLRMLSC